MITFLEKEGFEKRPDADQNIYVTTLKEMMGSAFFQKGKGTDAGIVPFSSLSKGQLTIARKKALEADVPLPEEGLFSDTLDVDLSIAGVKDGEVCAFLCVSCEPEGLVLSCAWNGSGVPATLALLLRACAHRAKEKYPEDTRISCQTVNGASAGIRRLILPDAEPISYTYSTYITV
jgi:hypothetical protein